MKTGVEMHGLRMRCDNCRVSREGICAVLDEEARAQFFQISRRKTVASHHVIFRDGDDADQCFNITSGVVKLVKTLADGQQHIVGLVSPPGFLGQTLNVRHTYSAESATEVELCAYPRPVFEAFLKLHPELEREIFHMTVKELDLCRDWTLLLGRKGSYERVAGFLLMMARRSPQAEGGNRAHFELPFTRAELLKADRTAGANLRRRRQSCYRCAAKPLPLPPRPCRGCQAHIQPQGRYDRVPLD